MSAAKWAAFVAEWSNLLLWLASRRVREHDEQMDLYTRSLTRVHKALDTKRDSGGMGAWLGVVVSNCHGEMMREQYGRFRYPACLRDANTATLDLYRLVYRDGLDYNDAGALLGLDRATTAARAEHLERALGRNVHTMRGIVSRRARSPFPHSGWASCTQSNNYEEVA